MNSIEWRHEVGWMWLATFPRWHQCSRAKRSGVASTFTATAASAVFDIVRLRTGKSP